MVGNKINLLQIIYRWYFYTILNTVMDLAG
jgi:hypothetical protein